MKKIIFLFFGFQIYAHAGSVEGPHLIWFNLSKSPAIMDAILADLIKSDPPICWDDGLILFMHAKPAAVTRELVHSAIVVKNKDAIASLNNLMKLPFEDAKDGFDGIVVYADEPQPMLYSLTVGTKKIQHDVVAKPVHIKGAFCNVIPATVRKP